MLTIKQLKEWAENLPDDTPVNIYGPDGLPCYVREAFKFDDSYVIELGRVND